MIRKPESLSLNSTFELTPLIDIIFIIIVFLLLTANPSLLSLAVDIPSSEDLNTGQTNSSNSLNISIFKQDPVWAIGQQRFANWTDFKFALLSDIADKSQLLSIAAEHDAEVEPLLKLLALLNKEQIPNTQILMEQE
tara:strand:- start:2879 stop:3289 length:411 start_codon:yes stop_codon:yes gene_type:complete